MDWPPYLFHRIPDIAPRAAREPVAEDMLAKPHLVDVLRAEVGLALGVAGGDRGEGHVHWVDYGAGRGAAAAVDAGGGGVEGEGWPGGGGGGGHVCLAGWVESVIGDGQ